MPPTTTARTTTAAAVMRSLRHAGWVESLAPAGGGAVLLTYNEPGSGLGLWHLDGAGLHAVAPGLRPDAGTLAPRGRRVACSARDTEGRSHPMLVTLGGGVRTLGLTPAVRPRALAWLDDDVVVTSDGVDGPHPVLVAVHASGTGEPRVLAGLGHSGRWVDPRPSVAPDGRVAYTAAGDAGTRIDVWDPATGRSKTVLEGNPSASPAVASWCPDGRRALCLVQRARGPELVLLDFDAGSVSALPLPRPAGMPSWRSDGRAIAVQLEDWPVPRLVVFDLATAEQTVAPLPAMQSALAPAWQHDTVVFLATAPWMPSSVWRWHPRSGDVRQISPAFDLPPHPEPRPVRVPSGRGFELPGLLHEPPSPRRDGAAVLFLHGGPSMCWSAGWDPVATAFVTAGFRVLQGETRSSRFPGLPGLSPGGFGHEDADDAVTLVEHLAADGAAVAIYAHSYGTFPAYRASTRSQDVRALVLTSGFCDAADLDASADVEVRRFRRYAFGDEPIAAQPELPATCPVLLVHGDRDTQVPIERAHDTVERLTGAGHRLLVLEGEGHAPTGREAIARWIPEAVTFVEHALGADAP